MHLKSVIISAFVQESESNNDLRVKLSAAELKLQNAENKKRQKQQQWYHKCSHDWINNLYMLPAKGSVQRIEYYFLAITGACEYTLYLLSWWELLFILLEYSY